MVDIIIPVLIFIFGTAVGSFLSVVIYRIHTKQKGIFLGRSICPSCKKTLGFFDLFPILSYLLSKGKCRHCHKPISAHYLFMEITSGLIFLAVYLQFPFYLFSSREPVIWSVLLSFIFNTIYGTFLLGIFFYDLKHQEIPDLMLFPLMVIAFIGGILTNSVSIQDMLIAALISAVVFGGQILISKGRWLGEGDLYLALGMALILGWQKLLLAIGIGYLIGAVICIAILLKKEAKMKTQIPFAPFLVLGTFFSIFFGEQLINWYIGLLTI